jgi:hypothetical protein
MGCPMSAEDRSDEDRTAKEKNDAIDHQLKQDRKEMEREIKILMLGKRPSIL